MCPRQFQISAQLYFLGILWNYFLKICTFSKCIHSQNVYILKPSPYSSIMETLEQVQPTIPVEILNLISTYLEDGPVVTRYHLPTGTRIHRIQWNSHSIAAIESTMMVQKFFPSYWRGICEPEYRCIYFNAKAYFNDILIKQRDEIPFR